MKRLLHNWFLSAPPPGTTAAAATARCTMLDIDGVPVRVERKAVRHLRVVIRGHDAAVRVSVPQQLSDARVRAFLDARREWIHHQRQRLAERNAARPPLQPRGWVHGESLSIFGEPRTLDCRTRPGVRASVFDDGQRIVVTTAPGASAAARRDLVESWLRGRLNARLPELVARWESVVGVSIDEIRLRRMRTRWGTCNIRARRVWLSTALAEHPLENIEYVLVHELVHLHERLHNARFHAFMDRFLPDWRERRDALDAAAPSAFLAPVSSD